MKLSDHKIEEFQKLYKKNFGEDINHEKAFELGMQLLSVMKLVYKPITKKRF